MQKRILGTKGLEVSALGFGCMGISQSYGQPLSRTDGGRDHPRSGRRRCDLLRYGRSVRPIFQ